MKRKNWYECKVYNVSLRASVSLPYLKISNKQSFFLQILFAQYFFTKHGTCISFAGFREKENAQWKLFQYVELVVIILSLLQLPTGAKERVEGERKIRLRVWRALKWSESSSGIWTKPSSSSTPCLLELLLNDMER